MENLDTFTQAYIEALFFTEGGPDNPKFEEKSINDFAPQTLEKIVKDCERFQKEFEQEIKENGFEQAGHDFWLTRNGHGAGFWDGDWPVNGEKLDKACGFRTEFPGCEVYIGDNGLIYIFGAG